jgi:hypothetical protein
MEREKKCWMLLIWIVAFSVLSIHSVEAVDELYLTGVIRSMDLRAGTVTVDVKSQSCKGMRRFRFDNTIDMEGLEGKKISFSIDSSVCKAGGIYKITAMTLMQEVNSR